MFDDNMRPIEKVEGQCMNIDTGQVYTETESELLKEIGALKKQVRILELKAELQELEKDD